MKKPESKISQPNAEDPRATMPWLLCTLAALKIGSVSNPPDAEDFIRSLRVRGYLAWCITSRDELLTQIGTPIRGLPSTDLVNQVRALQDQVLTRTGKAFVQLSTGPGTDTLLEPIDYFCWLSKVGGFQIPWHSIDSKADEYECYAAVLLGGLLGRLGKTIEHGNSIVNLVRTIIEQYERGEGRLPEPDSPQPSPRPVTLPPPPSQLLSQQLQLLTQQLQFLNQQASSSQHAACSRLLDQQLLDQQLLNQQLFDQQLLNQQLLSQQLQLLSQSQPAAPEPTQRVAPEPAAPNQLPSQQLPASSSAQPAALGSRLSWKRSNMKTEGDPERRVFMIGPDDETEGLDGKEGNGE